MKKYTRRAFCALILLLLPAACRSANRQASPQEIQALTAHVQGGSPPDFVAATAEARKIWLATQKVYELRGFRPAWTAGGKTTSQVDGLVRMLASMEAEGFAAEDIGMTEINARREAVKSSQDGEALAAFDTYLTYELMRHATYLSSGRTGPRTIDPNWRSSIRHDNLPQIVQDALEGGTLERLPDTLAPPHPEYRALKETLRRYREIAAKGGWAALPADLALKPGDDNAAVTVLRNNLTITGDLPAAPSSAGTVFDGETSQAVLRFQTRHGLKADGIVTPQTVAIMNVPVDFRIRQIGANLDRLRWLPNDLGAKYVLVNIPAYALEVREGEQVPLRMKVVVGANENRTPVFSDVMESVVFSPYWNIPESITTKEILPKIMKNPDYLLRQNIEVIKVGKTTQVINPSKINWDEAPGDFQYQLRQKPGARNSLGLVKFLFPNEFNVYLHDTPADNLFDRFTRNFSHGCVRVEHPTDLAAYVLRDQPEWTPEKIETAMHAEVEKHVALKSRIPVHIVYWTAWADAAGVLQIRPDVYSYGYPESAK